MKPSNEWPSSKDTAIINSPLSFFDSLYPDLDILGGYIAPHDGSTTGLDNPED